MSYHELTANYTDFGFYGTAQTGRRWPSDTTGATASTEGGSVTGTGKRLILLGMATMRQAAAAPLSVDFFNGTSGSSIVFTTTIGEDTAASMPNYLAFGPAGILFSNGLSARANSGTLMGVRIFWKYAE